MYRGMSDYEGYFRLVANNIYTNSLGKVEESQVGRYCKIKLISATKRELDLPLINIPVGRLIGTSSPVQKGMVISVHFSKWAVDQIILSGVERVNGEPTQELQFDRDNGYALPIVFDDMLDDDFPEFVTFHDKTIFEKEVEMRSTLDVDDDVGMLKGLTVVENVDCSDIISDVAGFNTHVHGGVQTGPGDTQGPK